MGHVARLHGPAIAMALGAASCGTTRLDAFEPPPRADAGPAVPSPALGVFGQCEGAATLGVADLSLSIEVCKDDVVHVLYGEAAAISSRTSMVVDPGTVAPPFTRGETADALLVTTSRLRVAIDKATGSISFSDAAGQKLLDEIATFSKRLVPATIDGSSTHSAETWFNLSAGEAIYGLGEHPGLLVNYEGRTQDLVQTSNDIPVPMLVSTRGYGLFWDNYSHMRFSGSEAQSTQFQMVASSAALVDYYFLYGPDLDRVIGNFRLATGQAPLFPKWAYGLIQSQKSYKNQSEIFAVRDGYRKAGIPIDVIVQDIDYWEPFPQGSHQLDPTRFPDPQAMLDSLHQDNVHYMISVWPVFTPNDDNYVELDQAGAMLPSDPHLYDPFQEQGRSIFWRQVKDRLYGYGVDSWWLEADEPFAPILPSTPTGAGKWMDVANAYPLAHARGVYQGQRGSNPASRVFTLSRSAFAGQQRFASAARAGDMPSTFASLATQSAAGLGFALSGMPYWATDIGAYEGTDWSRPENRELFTRWFQFGAFCPLFRIHGVGDRQLYASVWDDTTKQDLLKADQLRYRLLPYLYSLAWRVTSEGYTIMRHLVMDFRDDPNVYDIADQFSFGPSLMVSPVTALGATSRQAYLPEGAWYDFWTGVTIDGGREVTVSAPLDHIPIHVRAGSIVPMGPVIEYATESADPLELRVYRGRDGAFVLYEDDGSTYGYEGGESSMIPMTWDEASQTFTIGSRNGSFAGMPVRRTFNLVWVAPGYGVGLDVSKKFAKTIDYSGLPVTVKFDPAWLG